MKNFTITIGNKTKKDYLELFKEEKIKISEYAQILLEEIEFSKQEETVQLVSLTVAELGLKDYSTTKQIFERAKEKGYELCPAEVGPALRLQWRNQPQYTCQVIAMQPISDPDGDPCVFMLGHVADGVWLRNCWAWPTPQWEAEDGFVFRLRKKSLDVYFGTSALIHFGPRFCSHCGENLNHTCK